MSVYSVQNKGWRYDFTRNGIRHTEAWFKTRKAAQRAEANRKETLQKGPVETEDRPTDMGFLELVNRKLDLVKGYNSASHYKDYVLLAKRWVRRWNGMACSEITQDMVQTFILERAKVSPYVGNMEIRYLRATFNHGRKRKWITDNPLDGIGFLPVEKRVKHLPTPEDIDKVIAAADPETQDYLWVLRETVGRMGETNRLTWDDVDLENRCVLLYTRKTKGGHLTPRKVWMTDKLFEVLSRRHEERDKTKPWVFWHSYRSTKTGERKEGPYQDRKRFMRTLCRQAGVRYFRFHALRHSGASVMDNGNVPIGTIQRILGHENRTTTEIYLHGIGQGEREAMIIYEQFRKKVSHKVSHGNEEGARPIDLTP